VRGEDRNRQSGPQRLHVLEQRDAVHAGHAQVGDDEVRLGVVEAQPRLFTGRGGDDVAALGLEAQRQHAQQLGVVVDEENAGAGAQLSGHCRPASFRWRSRR
jgi:hypothetical protein